MIEYYQPIKLVHVIAVFVSGGLFLVRGCMVLAGLKLPMTAPVRYLSYSIDTLLLAAALSLAGMLHQYPFVHGWLTTKVVLLAIYIALGTFALKRGRSRGVKATCFVAALSVYAFMISVARTHHPLEIFGTT